MNRNATAILLIVLAIGIYLTFTRGLWTEVKAVQEINKQYTTAISNADELIQVRDEVLETYSSLSDKDRERLDKMIPNTVDNIRLIIDLNDVALKHRFTLENIRAAAAAAEKGVTPVPVPSANTRAQAAGTIPAPTLDAVTVSFDVTAPYLEFISFMQDLEANLRIMDLTRLSVAIDDTGIYSFRVELKTYWLRQ